jgi:broad specificity phosphatase PhoE
MTGLCLIRHGQTDWNLEGRYQGQGDVPLNEKGREQARAVARQLKGQVFTALYASDLRRAMETAEIIREVVNLPVNPEPRLREIDQGEWEGQLVEAIKARYTEVWQQRIVDPASIRPPGGETIREVATRVHAALDDVSRLHPNGEVLIVSHGLALATALCRVRSIPIGQAYGVIPDNAKPIWVDWVNEGERKKE